MPTAIAQGITAVVTFIASSFGATNKILWDIGYATFWAAKAAVYAALTYAVSAATRPKFSRSLGGELVLAYDPDVPRQMVIGRRLIGGSLVAHYSHGANLYNIHLVIALADHPLTSLQKVYGDGRLVWSTPLAHGTRTEITTYSYSGGARVWMTFHDGRPGQTADSDLVTKAALDPEVVSGTKPGWSSNHKGAGVAYLHLEVQWDSDILTSIPQFQFEVEGAALYDRRLDTTAGGSGTHRLDDPSTWAYSTNAAVALDHYLLGYQVEDETIAFGIGLLPDEVPYAEFAAAADLADEDVETGVGGAVETIKRYAANGIISAADNFETLIESLQLQLAARIVDLGGRLGILGAEARTPVVDLNRDDLVGDEQIAFEDKRRYAELIGAVEGRFSDPGNLYQPTEYERQVSPNIALPDGGEAQTVTVDFQFEIHPRRAARLASAYLEREQRQARLAATFMPWKADGSDGAWKLEAGDWFTYTDDILQIDGEAFEVIDVLKHEDFAVTVTAQAIDEDFVGFDNDNDPDLSVPPDVDPVNLLLDQPEFDAEADELTAGDVVEPCLLFTLTSDEIVAREIVVEYGVADPDWDEVDPAEAIVGPTLIDAFHVSQIVTHIRKGILPNSDYRVRAKAKAGLRESPFTDWSDVITTGATYSVGSAATVPWSGVSDDDGHRPEDDSDVTLTHTSAAITGQGWGATASEANASNAYSPIGRNATYQSEFRVTSSYWTAGQQHSGSAALTVGESLGVRYAQATGSSATTGWGTYIDQYPQRARFPVSPGERIEASAYVGGSNLSMIIVQIVYYDSSGVYLSDSGAVGSISSSIPAGGGNLGTYSRIGGFHTAPASAHYAAILVVGYATSSTPVVRVAHPFIGRANTSQTALSPWNQGWDGEAGADVTGNNTAASILGQGALALLNSLAYGGAYLSGFGGLAALGQIYFGDGYLKETSGGTTASLANFKTAIGTAAAIASQGALATVNSVAVGASGLVYRDDGVTHLTDALVVTSLGTASAIASQGALATLNQVALGSGGRVYRDDGTTHLTDALAVTALGTAAAIASQGGLATLSFVTISTNLRRADGTTVATEAMIVTILGTAASITSQGDLATTNLVQLPFGQNGCVNSDFNRGTYGWAAGWAGNTGLSFSSQGVDSYGAMERKYYSAAQSGTPSAGTVFDVLAQDSLYFSNTSMAKAKKFAIPVQPGDRIYASARVQGSNVSTASVIVDWGDASAAELSVSTAGNGAPGSGSYNQLNNYNLVGGFVTAPANARFAVMFVRANCSGGSNPILIVTEPMICRVPASQTGAPPYTPGRTDPIADDTAGNTAAGISGQGALATANTVGATTIDVNAVTAVASNVATTRTANATDCTLDVSITSLDANSVVQIDWFANWDGPNFSSGSVNSLQALLSLVGVGTIEDYGVVAQHDVANTYIYGSASGRTIHTPGSSGSKTYRLTLTRGGGGNGQWDLPKVKIFATLLKR